MSKWGKRVELSKAEAAAMLDATGKELVRQITRQTINVELVNVVRKGAKLLQSFNQKKIEKGE